jgi:hypothetical protein
MTGKPEVKRVNRRKQAVTLKIPDPAMMSEMAI